jgi:hypothetical protein
LEVDKNLSKLIIRQCLNFLEKTELIVIALYWSPLEEILLQSPFGMGTGILVCDCNPKTIWDITVFVHYNEQLAQYGYNTVFKMHSSNFINASRLAKF